MRVSRYEVISPDSGPPSVCNSSGTISPVNASVNGCGPQASCTISVATTEIGRGYDSRYPGQSRDNDPSQHHRKRWRSSSTDSERMERRHVKTLRRMDKQRKRAERGLALRAEKEDARRLHALISPKKGWQEREKARDPIRPVTIHYSSEETSDTSTTSSHSSPEPPKIDRQIIADSVARFQTPKRRRDARFTDKENARITQSEPVPRTRAVIDIETPRKCELSGPKVFSPFF